MPRVSKPRPGESIELVTLKSGDVRYRASVTTSPRGAAKRTQARKACHSLSEARQWIAATKSAVHEGEYVGRSKSDVSAMLDRWLEVRAGDVAAGVIRQVTLDSYRNWCSAVRRFMGSRNISDVRPSDVEAFKTWALTPGSKLPATKNAHHKAPADPAPRALSARTTVGALGALEQAFELARRDGLIKSNPVQGVKRPSIRNSRTEPVRLWTVDQLVQFLHQIDVEHQAGRLSLPLAVALRLAACGMRRSEVAGLSWDAVDFEEARVAVLCGRVPLQDGTADKITPPKSRRSRRWVYCESLAPGTMVLLRDLRMASGRPEVGLVVGEGWGGHGAPVRPADVSRGPLVIAVQGVALRPETITTGFHRVAAAAGLPRIKLHNLRHSLATVLAADPEVSDIDAASMLGHDVSVFVSTYAQPTDSGIEHAAQRFGDQITEAMGA